MIDSKLMSHDLKSVMILNGFNHRKSYFETDLGYSPEDLVMGLGQLYLGQPYCG